MDIPRGLAAQIGATIAEAHAAIAAARAIAADPLEAIREYCGRPFDQSIRGTRIGTACFDWQRVAPQFPESPVLIEAGLRPLWWDDWASAYTTPIARKWRDDLLALWLTTMTAQRTVLLIFPVDDTTGESPNLELDLLGRDGRPSVASASTLRRWAIATVAFGTKALAASGSAFPEPTKALASDAHAVRLVLLNAWPRGLKGDEIVSILDREHDLTMETTHLSGRIVPELNQAGCPVRNVRGVGYQLVPAGGAE